MTCRFRTYPSRRIYRRFAARLTQVENSPGLHHVRHLNPPIQLFAQSTRLSQMKVMKKQYRKPGLIPSLQWLF